MKLNWLAALGGVALTACTSDGNKVTDKPLNIALINQENWCRCNLCAPMQVPGFGHSNSISPC